MKVKYAPDHDEAKKPVVMIQVTKNPVGRAADEGNEFPQGTHLNRLRMAFEPLYMSASGGAFVVRDPPARRRGFDHKAPPEALMYNGSNATLRRFK